MDAYAVYIHIPFCRHRCAYCDFNTYAGQAVLIPAYVAALQSEIEILRRTAGVGFRVHTVYFGGGTPSLLPAASIAQILRSLAANFSLASDAEISLEANPGTVSLAYLRDLSAAGINRLSLGMQSAHPHELTLLERQHRFVDVLTAVKWARQAGITNLSLDLIFGLPEQRLEIWEGSLTQALNLAPEHFSLYALTIEPGTPLHDWAARGLFPLPDPDLAADMYQLAAEKLAAAGYMQYEISNWARENAAWHSPDSEKCLVSPRAAPQFACRHNLQYWRNQPYLGFGAGAHGFAGGFRTANIRAPQAYIQHLREPAALHAFPGTPATVETTHIDPQTEMNETMMMGLRLTQAGVSRSAFQARFGQDLTDVFASQIEKLLGWGLLEWAGPDADMLRLTAHARLLGNQVFREFV